MTGQDPWEDLQGSAVALASLFTFMQKEQQLEGWGVVPEHWAAGHLPHCIYHHIVTNNSPAVPTGTPPSFLIVLNMRLQAQVRSLCS